MLLAQLSAAFWSLLSLPTIKLGPCGADSWVGGCVYILGPYGSLQRTLLWSWEFLPLPPQPPQVFPVRGFEALFPLTGTWVVITSHSLPSCSSQFICTRMWDRPDHQPQAHLVHQLPLCWESSLPGCLSPPLLLVWMNVSSTPWSSDFHTVWFCQFWLVFVFKFVVLPLLVWGGSVYLCLHLGWKSNTTSEYLLKTAPLDTSLKDMDI